MTMRRLMFFCAPSAKASVDAALADAGLPDLGLNEYHGELDPSVYPPVVSPVEYYYAGWQDTSAVLGAVFLAVSALPGMFIFCGTVEGAETENTASSDTTLPPTPGVRYTLAAATAMARELIAAYNANLRVQLVCRGVISFEFVYVRFILTRMSNASARQVFRETLGRADLSGAVHKVARGVWDLREKFSPDWGAPKTATECIHQAVAKTRDLLSTFAFPLEPQIRYTGMRDLRHASEGRISDGLINLEVEFLSKSGARVHVGIPVYVREGQVLDPSVFLVDGSMRVISPSAVDALLRQGTFAQPIMSRAPFGAPQSPEEAGAWYDAQRELGPQPRVNPGMFATAERRTLLQAAVRGEASFRRASLPPARGDMRFQVGEANRIGDRMGLTVRFDPEQMASVTDGGLYALLRSLLLEQAPHKGWGLIADVRCVYLDRDAGEADLIFKSSEISAPQYAGADLRTAAAADLTQDESYLDPAERPDRELNFHAGDRVKLTKKFVSQSRGGPGRTLSSGAEGEVVQDVFGDGLQLAVRFDDDVRTVVPASMLKRAARTAAPRQAQTVEQVLAEMEDLRKAGYGPIDVLMTARQRYGHLGNEAIEKAKKQGLLSF